uniref:Uncharacterized protein n=1 Tax=Podoviridae sp. ctza028 TaxID=2825289 RepID=A0A8S5Q3A7_9CAUD|nr:MAG TPA: hypothetical protein [Podoviridae sp. ctza028]
MQDHDGSVSTNLYWFADTASLHACWLFEHSRRGRKT